MVQVILALEAQDLLENPVLQVFQVQLLLLILVPVVVVLVDQVEHQVVKQVEPEAQVELQFIT